MAGWQDDPVVGAAPAAPWQSDPVVGVPSTTPTRDDFDARHPGLNAAANLVTDSILSLGGGLAAIGTGTAAKIQGYDVGGAMKAGMDAVMSKNPLPPSDALNRFFNEVQDFNQRVGGAAQGAFGKSEVGGALAGAGAETGMNALEMWLTGRALHVGRVGLEAPGAIRAAGRITWGIPEMAAEVLKGTAPKPEDFMAAVMAVGEGASPEALKNIYVKTGIRPEQVAADAAENPKLREQLSLKDQEDALFRGLNLAVPDQYKPIADAVQANNAVPGDTVARKFLEQPFAEVPQQPGAPAEVGHVNYDYINGPEDLDRAVARLTELNTKQIEEQRRGPSGVPWDQTRLEASNFYHEVFGRKPDAGANAAQISAFNQMAMGAVSRLLNLRNQLAGLGRPLTDAEQLQFKTEATRASMILSNFIGAKSEVGRALNVLKDLQAASTGIKQISEVLDNYGGKAGVTDLMDALGEVKDPSQARELLQNLTPWQKGWRTFMEMYRASLLATMNGVQARVLGSAVMNAVRIPTSAIAAGIGELRGATEGRVYWQEPATLAAGMYHGALQALNTLGGYIRKIQETPEHLKGAEAKPWGDFTAEEVAKFGIPTISQIIDEGIAGAKTKAGIDYNRAPMLPGAFGRFIRRVGFGPDTLNDALSRTMNEHGVGTQLATRMALDEKIPWGTDEFNQRVAEILQSGDLQEQITKAGKDAALITPLGARGRAFAEIIKDTLLEIPFPFPRAMGNAMKWIARYTPGLNLLLDEWREEFKAGGARKDMALAQIAFGGIVMTAGVALARSGILTGGGSTSTAERRGETAAGALPYSIKYGDKDYAVQRIPIIGSLLGLTADMSDTYDKVKDGDPDAAAALPLAVSMAYAKILTSMPIMKGLSDIVDAVQHYETFGVRYMDNILANFIPLGQQLKKFAEESDEYVRQTYVLLDTIKNGIPGARETLFPKRDVFGEPIPTTKTTTPAGPIATTTESTDKVRTELARLKVAVPDTPRTINARLGGAIKEKDIGGAGNRALTPEERDAWAEMAGKAAYAQLAPTVNSPAWDAMPDLEKKILFEKTFEASQQVGRAAVDRGALLEQTQKGQAAITRRLAPAATQ